MTGHIKTLKPGFGFIRSDDGADWFFHHSDVAEASEYGFNELRDGDRVVFEPVVPQPDRGARASQVTWEPAQ